jgi:hypothetical protein
MGEFQSQKLAEISKILTADGTFITSYVNFGHRHKDIYEPYNNVQSLGDFRASLARNFMIGRSFPTSYNWNHHAPRRRLLRDMNMYLNFNVPLVGKVFAVEYFFICSPR